jgi:hypothetical protein
MGILNIVFGSLFLLCTICGGVGLLMMMSDSSMFTINGVNVLSDMWNYLKREVPAYPAVTIASLVAGLILNVVLLVAGIGLLNMQGWGRVLSLVYSVVSIIDQIAMLIFTIAYVNPATQRWQQDFAQRMARQMGGRIPQGGLGGDSTFNNILSLIGGILGVVYAIVLLVMMLRPSVAAAFGSGPLPEEPLADRYGEGGDEYERRRDPWNY